MGRSMSPWDRSSSCGVRRAAPAGCRRAPHSIRRPGAGGRARAISTRSGERRVGGDWSSDVCSSDLVGPFVELWRAARRTGRLPPRAALDSAAGRVGSDKVHLDSVSRTVRLDVPGMRIDLGGIAKGYILDRALDALRAQGGTRALLRAGGDIVLGDAPPGRPGWRIALPQGEGDTVLANRAVSTSGDTEQFVIIGGVRYSHVI